ncbi:GAF domain-containing protein [Herbaspirillum sp. WKF16]|uniref:ATP-binding protein n=1 Tax=Herbaspirillum sp. WKF16 TaxID=3028312 RepID=UPI0023A9B664|nr:ATP-binding protein [Herbaspirillum sp. WKF16]WDZ94236.1 GAF domain-containing protein [Herbaspirillum sp. WKF16]
MSNPYYQNERRKRHVDLSNCDQEPIHIPGSIQAHGALLTFAPDGTLAGRSSNAGDLLGPLPATGEALDQRHLNAEARAAIHAALDDRHGYIDARLLTLASGPFDVVTHKSEGMLIAEFEKRPSDALALDSFALSAHQAIQRIQRQQGVEDLLTLAVDEIARITGFDRVMAYRFLHDDSGEVIAEHKRADLEPFLGQRYPASDIPAQARRLYVINPIRLIADVGYQPAPIEPDLNPLTGRPLDLSHSNLRSVSPVHIEYLSNMGVGASMSLSIVIGDRLWGLIACHHMTPHLVPHAVRMSCQLLSQFVSTLVERNINGEHARALEHSAALRREIVAQVTDREDIVLALSADYHGFLRLMSSHGGAISLDRKTQTFGKAPSREGVNALVNWLNENESGDIFHTSALGADVPDLKAALGEACGVLAIRFYREQNGYAFWFRSEQVEDVRWGGNPEKKYTIGPLGPRLTPRGSFAVWKETVRGKSLPWEKTQLEVASQLRLDLQEVALSGENMLKRARETLLATLGHDLRDPLQAIMMAARMIEVREHSPSSSNLSKRISSSSSRMHRLISQVLDISRLQSGLGLDIQRRSVDVRKMIGEIVNEARMAYPDNEIIMEAEDCGETELDSDRVSQVISNLLSNTRHHGEINKPSTIIAFRRDDVLTISVSNHGAPIPEQVRGNLFKPYKKESLGNQRNSRGLGLGLYIVSEIVNGHGGRIAVDCEDGIITFTVTLPVGGPGQAAA